VDYVEMFIKFLEDYKENGEAKYVERIRKIKEGESELVVELADVYKYNCALGIKLINDILSGKEELIPQILEGLYSLLSAINPSIGKFRLAIPKDIVLMTEPNPEYIEEALKKTFKLTVCVVFVDGKRVGILPLPEGVDDKKLYLLIATLNTNASVSAGDVIYFVGRWEREGFVIDSVEVIKKSEEPIESRVNVKNLLSLYSLPKDYPARIIKFLENFKDSEGRYKYKEMIDEMIDKAGDLKVNLSLDDLLSYDKELGEIAYENPDYVLPIYMRVVDFYVYTRLALKADLLPWAVLIGEKVVLTQGFVRAVSKSLHKKLTIEEVAHLVGGRVRGKKIIVKFGKFVKFLFENKEVLS